MTYVLLAYFLVFFYQPHRKLRLLALLIAIDICLLSIITAGKSRRNETISSCLWTMEQRGKLIGVYLRPAVDWAFSPLEQNHCASSYFVENEPELWSPTYE